MSSRFHSPFRIAVSWTDRSGDRPDSARAAPTCSIALTTALLAVSVTACSPDAPLGEPVAGSRPPNILLLVADDLGYSDLGFLGSEIRTPNLDALAAAGTVLTDYHVSPACSPTRAMLLTGVDAHPAGLGTMAGDADENQAGQPGYEGVLADGVVTVAELLRDAGYLTAIAGKWHLGEDESNRPERRGFERSFVLLPGGASHFADRRRLGTDETPAPYREDGSEVELPADFYSTDFYTGKLIEYLGAAHDEERPFFALATYTSPHWPLQVPDGYRDRYRGAYDDGWDVLRARRTTALESAGVFRVDIETPERLPFVRAWEDLSDEERRFEAREMELFAAMVENLDDNIGRLLEFLEEIGELDNTFIMFSSDNGAEGNPIKEADWTWKGYDNSLDNLGRVGSYAAYGPGWAQAASAPFRLFKTFPTEGGTRVPAIVRLPGTVARGGFVHAFASVKDVVPTVLALAQLGHPGNVYRGHEVAELEGTSMLPFLHGESEVIHPDDYAMGWELFGRRALRRGNWKLVWLWEPYGRERWALYNLARDPGESADVADREPERLMEMMSLWDAYAQKNHVVLPAEDSSYARLRARR